MSEQLTELTGETGRVYQVRPLPKHFFLYYSEMPTGMSDRAALALKNGDKETFGQETIRAMTPEQLKKSLIFMREAVNFVCVNPRISLTPGEGEISPFEITEADFVMISNWAVSGDKGGQQAEGLTSFRGGQTQTAGSSASGKKLRKKSK